MDIVREVVDQRRKEGYADAEEESNELRRLSEEAEEWVKLGVLLVKELEEWRERGTEEVIDRTVVAKVMHTSGRKSYLEIFNSLEVRVCTIGIQ